MLVSWAEDLPVLFNRHPNLRVLCEKVLAHPKIAPVWSHIEF
jgi:hypothetical protein